jgi:hypothetical protein
MTDLHGPEREALIADLYGKLHTHELLTPLDETWTDAGAGVKSAFRASVNAALAAREEPQPSVSPTDKQRVKDAGYVVGRFGGKGWTLCGPDDHSAPLMVGSHGCVSPTAWECFAEAIRRIEQDDQVLAHALAAREEPQEANGEMQMRVLREADERRRSGGPESDVIRKGRKRQREAWEALAAREDTERPSIDERTVHERVRDTERPGGMPQTAREMVDRIK